MKTSLSIILFFISLQTFYSQTNIVPTGTEWQYYDGKEAPPYNWQTNINVTADWKSGVTPLGYGDSAVTTKISYGGNKKNKHLVAYFKKTFKIGDPFKYLIYQLKIKADDGIVVYLNGREIVRHNMPEGEITHKSTANGLIVSGAIEDYVHVKLLSPEDLVSGINTISASVHQARVTSVDCIFDIEFVGDNNPDMIPILLKDRTIKNLDLTSKMNELNSKLQLEKKDLQLEVIKQSKASYKIAFYGIAVIFLICALVLLFTLSNTRKKQLAFQKDINNLKEINSNKDRELMSSSLNTIQTQQFLKEIKGNLENSVTEDLNAIKKEIKKTIRQIDYSIEHDDDWINLSTHFNTLHVGYLDKLAQKHPSLTEMELRHCMFIKLFMQTKEIAQLLHVDPRSVQAARYRIKKKMNLGENVDLKTYLQEF